MADRKRPKQGFWRARKPWRKQGFWRARPKPGSVQDVQERLFDAICEGNLKYVKFFLKHDTHVAKINVNDQIGRSPLYMAAKHGRFEIVKFLLQSGADIHAKSKAGQSVLHMAAYSGNIDIFKSLHQNGAEINVKDKKGWISLHSAAYHGHFEVVKYLVQNGAWLNLEDKRGKTPLEWAISKCRDDIVDFLKQAEATEKEINIPSSNDVMSLNDVMTTDYYSILGVKKDTLITEKLKCEMRQTYQKLIVFHSIPWSLFPPDKNKSEDITEKIQRIKTAFEVLSHPQKKRIYDKYGEEGLKRIYDEYGVEGLKRKNFD